MNHNKQPGCLSTILYLLFFICFFYCFYINWWVTILLAMFSVFIADIRTQAITGKNSEQIKMDEKAKDLSLNLMAVIFLSIIIFGVLYVMMNPKQFEKSSYQKHQECMEEVIGQAGKHMYSGRYSGECDKYK